MGPFLFCVKINENKCCTFCFNVIHLKHEKQLLNKTGDFMLQDAIKRLKECYKELAQAQADRKEAYFYFGKELEHKALDRVIACKKEIEQLNEKILELMEAKNEQNYK